MQRKIMKIILFFVTFFIFGNNINAYSKIQWELISKSSDGLKCVYEHEKNLDCSGETCENNGSKLTLTFDNLGNFASIVVTSNRGDVVKYDVSNFKRNFDACPSVLESDTGGQISTLFKSSLGDKVYCGNIYKIPKKIPELTSFAMTIIQVAVPVILILMGSIDLFKGIMAGKEEEIKKGQQIFIKRLVIGAIIFFVVVLVKFFVSVVADTNISNMVSCIDCFVSNNCN